MTKTVMVEGRGEDSAAWDLPTAAWEQSDAPEGRGVLAFAFAAVADYRVRGVLEAWHTEQACPQQKALDPERHHRASVTEQERANLLVFQCAGRFGVAPPRDTCPLSKLYGCLKTKTKKKELLACLGAECSSLCWRENTGPGRQW